MRGYLGLFVLVSALVVWVGKCIENPPIALPGCKDRCGDVKIPYPFGIGPDNCSHDPTYHIFCNTAFHPPKPFLQYFNPPKSFLQYFNPPLEVTNVTYSEYQQVIVRYPAIHICDGAGDSASSINFTGTPYRYSTRFNVLMVMGCGGIVRLMNQRRHTLIGCASVCPPSPPPAANNNRTLSSLSATDCYGVGCCQTSINSYTTYSSAYEAKKQGLKFYKLHLDRRSNSIVCNLSVALTDREQVTKISSNINIISSSRDHQFPVVLEWTPTYFETNFIQLPNVSCEFSSCFCTRYYKGNPYLPYGCQVVPECRKCKHRCASSYRDNDPSHEYFYCENPFLQLRLILGFKIGVGIILLLLASYWLYIAIKQRIEVRRKAKFFKRNGGLLLQQISSSEGLLDKTKVFRTTELEKATNKFNKDRILGQGGQGTVYKGMLTDGKIVAIKKSKQVDESQLEQFINELVILSQINHRNVVNLFGCCLETEVPLLVYEFIPNGTLYQHLHNPTDEFHLTWEMRLQIAAESADAVTYLHSSSSTPVYHRDIKSSNILLDEKYRAKVSDFGASRAITIEQTHVTTCVLGTYGYLDPEYFQSNQFTEKSDVYSFGVVLAELITGRKPICPTKSGGWINLACEFLSHMETAQLFDILDKSILLEGMEEEFIAVADIAKQCLNMDGKQRPTMKEIAALLDKIRSHNVPISRKPQYVENNSVVAETSETHSTPFSENMFFL